MTITTIREKLISYLTHANPQKIKAMYILFEENIAEEEQIPLTKTQIKIIEERKAGQLSGKDQSYTWQEVHSAIGKKRKAN